MSLRGPVITLKASGEGASLVGGGRWDVGGVRWATFWFLKCLDNNIVYSLGICRFALFWVPKLAILCQICPPRNFAIFPQKYS